MSNILQRSIGCWLLLCAVAGCQAIDEDSEKSGSPLQQLSLSSDGVALEIITVRFPHGDAELTQSLWDYVDEQKFSADRRRELSRHGFRAGVLGERLPPALERMLAQQQSSGLEESKLEQEPPVLKRVVYVRAGRKCEVLASSVYEELPLLGRDADGAVGGDIYRQAQGLFTVNVFPQHDGRVRLKVVPELQHGQPKQQFLREDGMFRPQAVKPRRVFDELELDTAVGAGQMLVLAAYPETGSVGHYFLTEGTTGSRQQKLIIIRLAKTKYDDLFAEHTKVPTGDEDRE